MPLRLERRTDKHRELQLLRAETHKWKLPQGPVLGREMRTVTDELLEAQCEELTQRVENSREIQS